MKKVMMFVIVLSLLIGMTACSSPATDGEQTTSMTETQADTTQANDDEAATTEATQADTTTSQASNDNLEGVELLKSIFSKGDFKPDKLYVKLKLTGEEIPEIVAKYYYVGDSFRNEMNMAGLNNINIYDSEEGYVYSYTEGEKSGTKMKSQEAVDSGFDFSAPYDEETDEDDFEGLVTARYETLDGKKVVYVEYEDFDEDMGGNYTTKFWYSLEYKFPLKMQVLNSAGNVKTSMEIIEIEGNKDFSNMIIPPQDVEFVEY